MPDVLGEQSCQKGALTMTVRSKSETTSGVRASAPPVPVTDITQQQLAQIGEGELAYLRSMGSEEVRRLFPQVPPLSPGQQVFALFGADGAPILLADSRATAMANAWKNELKTVSLH
jgi:hypothetical protein